MSPQIHHATSLLHTFPVVDAWGTAQISPSGQRHSFSQELGMLMVESISCISLWDLLWREQPHLRECTLPGMVHIQWLVHGETTPNGMRTPELWTGLANPESPLQFNLSLYPTLPSSLCHPLCLFQELHCIHFCHVNLCFPKNWPETCIMSHTTWLKEECDMFSSAIHETNWKFLEGLPIYTMKATDCCKVLLLQYFPTSLLSIASKKVLIMNREA